jgi:hypothetical protein
MLKVIHVLAVGLWFGAGMFFTFVVGLSLFDTFEKETVKPSEQRPYWLPEPPALKEKSPPSPRFPDPLRKEQGSRIAGAAVGPMFRPYYLLQVVCGALGVLTALAWSGRGGVHRWRVIVLVLALAGAGAGWWLEGEVERLREARARTSDAVLTNEAPSAEQVASADEARAKFGTWHAYSLFANFGTLALVTAAMAMAAALPPREPAQAA